MSAVTIDNDLVHYEVLGRGRPVILVHGWLGSWRYWVPTMQQLSGKYRAYALDLWGFGDSGKDANKYGLREQVQLLFGFFERLGIPKAVLIGHALGGAVCLSFARQYPDRAHRVMLIGMPLTDMGGLSDDAAAASAVWSAGESSAALKSNSSAANPPPVPASQRPTGAIPTPPLPSAASADIPQYSSTSETIPRNPFRTRGESQEDILARLRARSLGNPQPAPLRPESEKPAVPAPASNMPARPATPVLPTTIGTPIMPNTPPPRLDDSSPLVATLSASKPGALLLKHVDRDTPDLETLRAEVEKADELALVRTAQSVSQTNLALELKRLAAPTLLLHGEDDALIAPPAEDLLRRINAGKPAGHFLPLIQPALRHFPMLEMAARFNRLLVDFLEAPDLVNIQFKDQWRRTMR